MKLRPANTTLLLRRLCVAMLLAFIACLLWQAYGPYLLERAHGE